LGIRNRIGLAFVLKGVYPKQEVSMDTMFSNRCEVEIEGIGPGILLHNPSGMGKNKKAAKSIPTPEAEAEAAAYWTDDKSSLAFPGDNIRSALTAACAGWKLPSNKKLSLGLIVAGDVNIEPIMVPFGTLDYEIMVKRVVVQRQGVLRARPLLKTWKLKFIVAWEAAHLGDDFHSTVLPELLDRLGGTIGIGDFRPARKGPYGRFHTVSIKKVAA